jgi:hypothetical protein
VRQADKEAADSLMSDFARRTGLASASPRHRYLWTDSFAVINLLALLRHTNNRHYDDLARALIDQVHQVLGHYRPDDARSGWLSGLSEQEGAEHPTLAGLRIGKPLPERGADEPPNARLEWDRDGQYFHYLTKWMDALSRAGLILNETRFHRYSLELAKSIFPHFLRTTRTGEPVGLSWKMSIDLARVQVPGINPHDALDGYVTFRQISDRSESQNLQHEIRILRELSANQLWETDDPLGLGGLLMDGFRLAELPNRTAEDDHIIANVLAGAVAGCRQYFGSDPFAAPSYQRLAFRELGLAIGLQSLPAFTARISHDAGLFDAVGQELNALQTQVDREKEIVDFWSKREQRSSALWQEHRDINDVMLATALLRAYVKNAAAP